MSSISITPDGGGGGRPSRYKSQKRRDWNTFCHYLQNHRPPLALSRCSGAHVLEFLRYLDQFGKTKVHLSGCPFFGHPHPPSPCLCPLKQAWGSLDAIIGRLRAAFEENGGRAENNPFGARAVRLFLREVRDSQAKARGVSYEKKKKKRTRPSHQQEGPDRTPPAVPGPAVETGVSRGRQVAANLNFPKEGYGNQIHEYFGVTTGESGGVDNMEAVAAAAAAVPAEAHPGGMRSL